MTDREKIKTIKQWINEAISQGNRTILVMAIKAILDEPEEIIVQRGMVKLSEKSLDILRNRGRKNDGVN